MEKVMIFQEDKPSFFARIDKRMVPRSLRGTIVSYFVDFQDLSGAFQ